MDRIFIKIGRGVRDSMTGEERGREREGERGAFEASKGVGNEMAIAIEIKKRGRKKKVVKGATQWELYCSVQAYQ